MEGKVFSGDYRIILPSLEKRIIHQKGEVIFDELLRPMAMVASVWDVTEQRRLEKLVFDNQKLIDKYVIISSTDIQGNITAVSEAFCRISGYTKSELLGKSHNIVRHPDMPREAFRQLWTAVKEKGFWTGYVKNQTKSGNYYWVFATVFPTTISEGTKGYLSCRRRATQEEIDESIELYKQMNAKER